jgi:4'-phosphopantetheinyl transferase EntD
MILTTGHEPGKYHAANGIRDALTGMTGPGVGCSVLPIQAGHQLLPDEERYVANAVESRRREFATGRACARTALAEVGCPPAPIQRGRFYEPVWPCGYAGSITHNSSFAAAIAYATEYPGHLGIDLLGPADSAILAETTSTFLTPSESRNTFDADPWRIAKIFSAKEAVIKILSVRLQMFLDFLAIESRFTSGGLELYAGGCVNPIVAKFAEFEGTLITLAAE